MEINYSQYEQKLNVYMQENGLQGIDLIGLEKEKALGYMREFCVRYMGNSPSQIHEALNLNKAYMGKYIEKIRG